MFKKLNRSFYLRDTLEVAQDLLGKLLVRKIGDEFLAGKIVEVEAYLQNDPAAHSFNGKTERNSAMFLMGGHLYVYFTYGMHYCANIVTESENHGSAVLLRALEPVMGLETLRNNRKRLLKEKDLTNGPAKLCQAFGITKQLNKADLTKNDIFCTYNDNDDFVIEKTGRIGIKKGTDKLWRFYIKDNPFVSAK